MSRHRFVPQKAAREGQTDCHRGDCVNDQVHEQEHKVVIRNREVSKREHLEWEAIHTTDRGNWHYLKHSALVPLLVSFWPPSVGLLTLHSLAYR